MIRVLHVVHTMECGGIETMLMNIYRKIDRNNIQFDFLVNGIKENYYSKEIESLGGKIINVTPKRASLRKNMREIYEAMRLGKYKIVHIHQDSMIAFAIYCAKKANIHAIFTHAHTTSANGWYRRVIARIARKYIVKNATEKFACSEAAAKWIYGKNVTNYILFKNAINAEVFRYDYRNCHKNRTEAGICDDNQFVIGTCGRLSPEKNQIFLVEIFAEIKKVMDDSKLILIGDGSEKENILNQAIKLDVDKDIIWTGMVSNASYYYSMLDCFVLPSIFEGLPLAGVEAQAAGILCFFSTGITSEIKITDKTYFLELERGPEYWAKEILLKRCSKEDTYDLVLDAGYDIGENVGFLQKTYMKYSVEI